MSTVRQRVLITGGCGFIGKLVAEQLRGDYHVVTLDVKRDAGIVCDVRDDVGLRKAVMDLSPHVVVHLAATHFIPYCDLHPGETVEINTIGTMNLVRAMQEANVWRLVFASTNSVYAAQERPHLETDPTEPDDIYGWSKLWAEQIINSSGGLMPIVLRLFNVYGPGDPNPHFIPSVIDQIKRGQQTIERGNLDTIRDYVWVHDVVRAIVNAIQLTRKGVTVNFPANIGTGEGWSGQQVIWLLSGPPGSPILRSVLTKEKSRLIDRPYLVANKSRAAEFLNWNPRVRLPDGLKMLLES